jgi:hypothetical protein
VVADFSVSCRLPKRPAFSLPVASVDSYPQITARIADLTGLPATTQMKIRLENGPVRARRG